MPSAVTPGRPHRCLKVPAVKWHSRDGVLTRHKLLASSVGRRGQASRHHHLQSGCVCRRWGGQHRRRGAHQCGWLLWCVVGGAHPSEQVRGHGTDRGVVKHQCAGQLQTKCLAQLVGQLNRRQAVKATCSTRQLGGTRCLPEKAGQGARQKEYNLQLGDPPHPLWSHLLGTAHCYPAPLCPEPRRRRRALSAQAALATQEALGAGQQPLHAPLAADLQLAAELRLLQESLPNEAWLPGRPPRPSGLSLC